jgi:hypothetical protein
MLMGMDNLSTGETTMATIKWLEAPDADAVIRERMFATYSLYDVFVTGTLCDTFLAKDKAEEYAARARLGLRLCREARAAFPASWTSQEAK